MKIKFIFTLIFFAVLFGPVSSSDRIPQLRLSNEARISLLTCSPGDELYSIFGHSAIRVEDPLHRLDWVFNYGTFDFSDPNFYTNFVRGKLNYILSVSEYSHFEDAYRQENRWIWEQELNITHAEMQHLFDSLRINRLPENRYYLYDFFFDNCATRIRDIFYETLDREILFDYSALESGKTFRELLMPYLPQKPWARLGINLGLGMPADRLATPWDYMFLPDHMMTVFSDAMFENNSNPAEFTLGDEVLLDGREHPAGIFRITPLMIFLLLLAATIALSYRNLQEKSITWWFDRILFGAAGLLGMLIAFLWFATDHQVTIWNLNILWAHPFHLIAVFFFSEKKYTGLIKYYAIVNMAIFIILFISWPLLPQSLPLVIIPLILSMLVRSAFLAKMLRPDLAGKTYFLRSK